MTALRVLALILTAGLTACGAGAAPAAPGAVATAGDTASAAATTAAPAVTPGQVNPCALGPQAPPAGTITAAYPTALAFAPDGRLFWAERSGTVRVWQNGAAKVFATVATVTTEAAGGYSERGLLGLAISPGFAHDHLVYAFFSNADRAHQTVIRWADCAGTGTNPTTIITLPAGGDCCHKGGRLALAPDGHLFVTLGEEHTSAAAQNTADVRGKLLRYNADGSVPGDNPFGNPVWAYGLRNPFGIAVSASGQVAITNNGPSGDAGSPPTGYDTVIASIARGSGHQWALCYGYSHPIAPATSCGGQPGPDWSSEGSTVVPTGATFVDAAGPAGYAGHLVFCTFNSGARILTPGSPATVAAGAPQCRLDIRQGPNHALYYSDTGAIYRLG
ncbi:MAG TPA: PQQ-dependent sugar dehydrogenase [Candidatus Dormibacteraeota bacterium]|jgi:glucose/arabinose dehydrogenase